MHSTQKAVMEEQLPKIVSATLQVAHRFFEQEMPRIASMLVEKTRRAMEAIIAGERQTAAAAPEGAGSNAAN